MMIASSLPPHFWAEAVATSTYLINIQPSAALQGGIPLERLSGSAPAYSILRSFGCVCYVLLPPRERTKLTAQSVECVFLGYSDEHKGYRCWDLVGRRMRISRDVTFDETRPFYPRPTSGSYPVDDLSFLLLPDTPPVVPPSPPLSSDVSPSVSVPSSPPSSSPSSPRSPAAAPSSAIPSSSSSDDSSSADKLPSSRPVRQRRAPNHYSPSQYGLSVVPEPTSYRDAERHPEWQLAMVEEFAALERTGTWDLVSPPSGVRPITCKWVYKIKTCSDGSLARYKARLVARRFQQEQGRDLKEHVSPNWFCVLVNNTWKI